MVIDERAQHVISLLSGHAGGANALARYLAGMLGADPVITTATDVNDMAALDTLAFQLNARMSDFRSAVKIVNQMLVSNKRVGLWWDDETDAGCQPLRQARIYYGHPISTSSLNWMRWCASPYAPIYLSCLFPHWKLVPQRVVAGAVVAVIRRSRCWLRCLPANSTQQLDPLALKAIGSITR